MGLVDMQEAAALVDMAQVADKRVVARVVAKVDQEVKGASKVLGGKVATVAGGRAAEGKAAAAAGKAGVARGVMGAGGTGRAAAKGSTAEEKGAGAWGGAAALDEAVGCLDTAGSAREWCSIT